MFEFFDDGAGWAGDAYLITVPNVLFDAFVRIFTNITKGKLPQSLVQPRGRRGGLTHVVKEGIRRRQHCAYYHEAGETFEQFEVERDTDPQLVELRMANK